MHPNKKKIKLQEETNITGYIHNVSTINISFKKIYIYFNTVIQVSRDEFYQVAVFKAEKHNVFVQAQNCGEIN